MPKSSVPKRSKAVLKLSEKVKVLDKLRNGMSVAAVGREFKINESTVRSIRKKEVEIRNSVKESAPDSTKVTSVVRDINIEKMEKRLNLWIEEMVRVRKSRVDSYALRKKALR